MSQLQYGICGEINAATKGELNPQTYLRDPKIQELLLWLNRNPCPLAQLLTTYPNLSEQIGAMLNLGMLRQDGDCFVNFTLIDQNDGQLVWAISAVHARELSRLLADRQSDLWAALSPLATPYVDVQQLAFLVLGCYLLDWSALEALHDWGVINRRKPQPGGNNYTLWAEEVTQGSLRGVYWGGHSLQAGEYLLHTFGDHDAETKRLALPDILYRINTGEIPSRSSWRALQMRKNVELGTELAQLIGSIGRGGAGQGQLAEHDDPADQTKLADMLELLQALGYVVQTADGQYMLQVPYFDSRDLNVLQQVAQIVKPVLRQWIDTSLSRYRQDISTVRSLQNGVPFKEVFVQCWHIVFGLTNLQLANRGVICDTYSHTSRWRGYLPGAIKGPLLQQLDREFSR